MATRRTKSASAMAPAITFHPFRKLPAELRIQVYTMAIQPRFVEIVQPVGHCSRHCACPLHARKCKPRREKNTKLRAWKNRYFSRAPIPALLHTCAESRQILMEHHGYQLAFRCHPIYRDIFKDMGTWVSFKHDILYLNTTSQGYVLQSPPTVASQPTSQPVNPTLLARSHPNDVARVKQLAVEDILLRGTFSSWGYHDVLGFFGNLEQVFVVQCRVSRHETLPWLSNRVFGGRGIQPDDKIETWEWLSCEEADLIPPIISPAEPGKHGTPWLRSVFPVSVGNWTTTGEMLWLWKAMNDTSDDFFEDKARLGESSMKKGMTRLRLSVKTVPKIHFAIVGRPSVLDEVRKARKRYYDTVEFTEDEATRTTSFRVSFHPSDSPDAEGSLEKQIEEAQEWEETILREVDEELEKYQLHQAEEDKMEYEANVWDEVEVYSHEWEQLQLEIEHYHSVWLGLQEEDDELPLDSERDVWLADEPLEEDDHWRWALEEAQMEAQMDFEQALLEGSLEEDVDFLQDVAEAEKDGAESTPSDQVVDDDRELQWDIERAALYELDESVWQEDWSSSL